MQRFPDDAALGSYVAGRVADVVRAKPDALVCIAAGTSSLPVFDALLKLAEAGEVSFDRAAFLGMDEWCGVPQDGDGAMADFLHKNFLDRVKFQEVFLFDGMADPQAECARAEGFLARRGGLDAIVFGIGVNGHVALNEPGVDPALRTHVAQVAPVTATVAQKYFQAAVPPLVQGITIGIANAAEAGKIWLVANTPAKREAVERTAALAAAGTPSAQVPASLVAVLPQAELAVTDAVFAP